MNDRAMNNLAMNDLELSDLLGLYIDGDLTESLRAYVEQRAAADSAVARELATLTATRDRLRAAAGHRPDPWFVERALDGLLRANNRAAIPDRVNDREETLTLLDFNG